VSELSTTLRVLTPRQPTLLRLAQAAESLFRPEVSIVCDARIRATGNVTGMRRAMIIRDERQGDEERIRSVNLAAFDTSIEADLVDALRRQATPLVSLVAEDDANVIGHILFSPVTLASDPGLILMGLAPMAVVPSRQRQGVGSTLVREGVERCRQLNVAAVVVLGHSGYYPRFGFIPAVRLSLRSEYDVPDEAFMVHELQDGALRGLSGTIRYHPVFRSL
jgi:putative acetyltransferase